MSSARSIHGPDVVGDPDPVPRGRCCGAPSGFTERARGRGKQTSQIHPGGGKVVWPSSNPALWGKVCGLGAGKRGWFSSDSAGERGEERDYGPLLTLWCREKGAQAGSVLREGVWESGSEGRVATALRTPTANFLNLRGALWARCNGSAGHIWPMSWRLNTRYRLTE